MRWERGQHNRHPTDSPEVQRWREAHEQLQLAQAKLEVTKVELTHWANQWVARNGEMVQLREQLREHRLRKPDAFEDSFEEWADEDQKLEAQFQKKVLSYVEAKQRRDGLNLQAVRLGHQVFQLQFVERNSRILARGQKLGEEYEGGVFRLPSDDPRPVR